MASYCNGGKVANPNPFAPVYNGLPCDDKGVHFTSIQQIPMILGNIIQLLLFLIAILAVIFIMVSAIRYITSEGDSSRTAQAKSALTNAIIGLVLSASAYLIIDFITRQF